MEADTKQEGHLTKCAACWKAPDLCLCKDIQASPTRTKILILQHPQEARNPWGTARLTSLALPSAVHKVGLSWRSLGQALGTPAEPSRWGVLYLGALKDAKTRPDVPFQVITREGKQVASQNLEGIVLLDGNWKQSKTLWWRNPWLTRMNRIVLNPGVPSVFNRVSRQPRKDCLCTIESVRHSLAFLEKKNEEVLVRLDELLKKHVELVELKRPAPRRPQGSFRRRHKPSGPRPSAQASV